MYASVIVPVYSRTEWLEQCLLRLCRQKFRRPFEIIVVDDGSPNGFEMEAIVRSVQGRSVTGIRYTTTDHAGPAAARNHAAGMASGDILCFVDDDSLVDEEWLREITAPFESSERAAVVNGKTLSLQRGTGLSPLLEKAVYSGKSWATCNIAYRRSVFDALGGFDASFPEPSWEDNDLGMRARWAGHRHDVSDTAIVYHPHESSLEEYRKKCMLNGRGAAGFARKYLFRKPLWSIAAPCLMARRLVYGIFPSVWLRRTDSIAYLRYLWSWYSLRGFVGSIGLRHGKN